MRNIDRSAYRNFSNLRLVPVVLASAFLVSVPLYFGGACFYNWELQWQIALMLWIAALGLWLGRWWSKLIAIDLSGFLLYRFIYLALKVHGVVAISPEEGGAWQYRLTAKRYDYKFRLEPVRLP